MEMTENLELPYLMPSQAQKHVTHNEALRALDALVQLVVASRNAGTPPATPRPGERYIVADDATGAWAGHAGSVAAWQDGTWMFYAPRNGWLVYALDEGMLLRFDGIVWTDRAVTIAELQNMILLGINATADAGNRLALSAEGSLFSHEGAGHRLKINKAAAADTASVLFQTDWSGRAEFGLAGDDDFHLKVSADGTAFIEALVIDKTTGKATFPSGVTGVRETLTAARTLYVANTGSNTNDGRTTGTAFATLQKAVDEAGRLDCSIYDVTIRLADGNYAGASVSRPLLGGGTLFIVGNETTPANVVITSGTTVGGAARVSISVVRFALTVDYHHALTAGEGARLRIGKVDFGPTALNGYHVNGTGYGEIAFEQDYTISGSARRHLNLSGPMFVGGTNRTITLTGTPAIELEFFYVSNGAIVTFWNLTIAGAATGRRYAVTTCGVINLYGKAADFLPGDMAGTTASGGTYV